MIGTIDNGSRPQLNSNMMNAIYNNNDKEIQHLQSVALLEKLQQIKDNDRSPIKINNKNKAKNIDDRKNSSKKGSKKLLHGFSSKKLSMMSINDPNHSRINSKPSLDASFGGISGVQTGRIKHTANYSFSA